MTDHDLFHKRIYACLIGLHVTDEALHAFLDACRQRASYIAGVAVNLCQVGMGAAALQGTLIQVVAPIAYPLGSLPIELKSVQLEDALRDGASAVAAVMRWESLRAGDDASAQADAAALAAAAARYGAGRLALIGSAASLSDAQAIDAARIARDVGAAYVTSAGFGAASSPEHVRALRRALGSDVHIIAAGGIRTVEQALAHLDAGADAIATSAPLAILEQLDELAV